MATDNKKNKAFVLKDKLKELVKAIVEGDDYTENAANEAITTLSSLKNLKCDTPSSSHHVLDHVPVPPQFLCPISGKLMADPVILANGRVGSFLCSFVFSFPCFVSLILLMSIEISSWMTIS